MTAPAIVRRWGQGLQAPVGWPNEGGAAVDDRHAGGGEAIGRRLRAASTGWAARDRLVELCRAAPLAAALLTVMAAHAGLAPHLAVRGLQPDLLLVAVAAVAAGRGARAGAAFGFAAGLGADLFLATPLATSALAYTLVGHVVGRLSRRTVIRRAALRRSVTLAFLAVAAGRAGTAVVATALGGIPFPTTAGLLHIVGVAVVSAPLGIPAVAAGRRFGRDTGSLR